MIKTILTTVLLTTALWVSGQKCTIRVKCQEDSIAIPFSHICIENKTNVSYAATNEHGEIKVPSYAKCILSVSSVGYGTYMDTVCLKVKEKTIYLPKKNFTTDAVVITGQYKATARDKSIYSIKVIDHKQIEQLASNNLAELLNQELNVKIQNDPSTGSSIQLQGISGENIKILVDGVPIIGRLDGNLDLSQINLEDVDHIEIVEGPMSVSYGSNALGGVINIITKENAYTKGSASVRSYYESIGQYNVHADAHYRMKKHNVRINGGRKFFEGYSLNDSMRAQTWKPKEQYNLSGHYILRQKKSEVKIKSDFFKERLWNKGNLLAPYYEKAYDRWFYTQRFNNSFHLNHYLDSVKAIHIMASHSYYHRMSNKYLKDLTDLSQQLTDNISDHDTIRFNTSVLRAVLSHAHPSLKFQYQIGMDINHEKGEGKRMKNNGDQMSDLAIFASMQWLATKRLIFQPGFRISYNSKYNAPLTPSFNAKYTYKNSTYRMSYARGFRAPSLKELNLYFYDSNHQIEGNEDLKAESSHNFNAFYSYRKQIKKQAIQIHAKAFHNRIQDMIALVQVDPDNPLHYRNENIGEFKNLGGVLELVYAPINRLKFRCGATLTGRKDATYTDKDYIYSTITGGGIHYTFFRYRMNLIATYKYFGKTPYYIYSNEEIKLNYSEDYHNMDIHFNARFFANRVTLGGGVKNLFDNTIVALAGTGGTHSSSGNSLVGWGRTFYVSASYKIIKY